MFEALACGIPLISAPWDDCEGLFRAGEDYLSVSSGETMARQLAFVWNVVNPGARPVAACRSWNASACGNDASRDERKRAAASR